MALELSDRAVAIIADCPPNTHYTCATTRTLAAEVLRLRAVVAALTDEICVKDARMAELEEMVR